MCKNALATSQKGLGQKFETPARWLAIVIVRSCPIWRGRLDRLCTIHLLAASDVDRIRELPEKVLKVTEDPKEFEEKEVVSR